MTEPQKLSCWRGLGAGSTADAPGPSSEDFQLLPEVRACVEHGRLDCRKAAGSTERPHRTRWPLAPYHGS